MDGATSGVAGHGRPSRKRPAVPAQAAAFARHFKSVLQRFSFAAQPFACLLKAGVRKVHALRHRLGALTLQRHAAISWHRA